MQTMDEVVDFLVVGSGGGAVCAGLVLRQAGKSVLVLEKTELLGGTTAKSGGVMWIPNNRFMRAEGVEDSLGNATAYLDSLVGSDDIPSASRARRSAYLREAPAMIDFLVDQGVKLERMPYWPDYYDNLPGGSERGRSVIAARFNLKELGPWKDKLRPGTFKLPIPLAHVLYLPLIKTSWRARFLALTVGIRGTLAKLTGKEWAIGGAALQGRLLQAALRAGIEFRANSEVKELILEGGAVIGVATSRNGGSWRVGARHGVLLNAGGFAQNQAMRDTHLPHTSTAWSQTAPGDTGDMHLELMRIGAAMGQMSALLGNQVIMAPGLGPVPVQTQLTKPHAFLVDQSGQRYMNEACSYMEFCQRMLDRQAAVPAVPSWMIVDSQFLRKYMIANTMPGLKKPQQWVSEGFMRVGASIESLAEACGIDPTQLMVTTARFNGHARSGRDTDFHRGDRAYDRWLGDYTHKPSAALGTVEVAPFYAFQVFPGDVGTFGGAVTDVHARVLRENGTPIPGLYATGTTAASVMGRVYPGAGSSVGPSMTWAYVAAKHALGATPDRASGKLQARVPT